jgi:hypothetical protein
VSKPTSYCDVRAREKGRRLKTFSTGIAAACGRWSLRGSINASVPASIPRMCSKMGGPTLGEDCPTSSAIDQCRSSLDESDRQILVLRYEDQLSFAEIAAKLGAGLSAVKMRHVRALERLRGLMGDHRREPGA